MPSPLEVALNHQNAMIRLGQSTTERAVSTWRLGDVDALDASWDVLAPVLVDAVSEAQIVAARQSSTFNRDAMASYGSSVSTSEVVPEALSGVMIDGREVGPAMFGAVTTTKTLIGRGVPRARAFESGASFLAAIVRSAVSDSGRQADRVDATGKGLTRYVRVVSPGACSRCAVQAGKGEYRVAFKRHPSCKCTSMPLPDDGFGPPPKGFYSSPDDYFESLDAAEQNRVFTNAGAQAIRDGADPTAVVNARRGANLTSGGLVERRSGLTAPLGYDSAGRRIQVFTTGEGTSIRGAYGRAEYRRTQEATKAAGDRYRRTTSQRLMPETIYQIADGNQERAVSLLRQYGYIT